MLSTAKQSLFNFSQQKSNEKLYKKSKFTNFMISPLEQYNNTLKSNQIQLKKKFPLVQLQHIRSLLQELDNNVEMVANILVEQDQEKHQKHFMQQEKLQNDSINKERINLAKFDDIKLLKSSLAKLYMKLKQSQKEKQQLNNKLNHLTKENQNLKLINKQLLEQQFQSHKLIEDLNIC